MLGTELVVINSYEFNLKPFAYRLNLEGRLEISSRYKLGTKLLSGKLFLPNQTVDLIDIIPDNSDKCFSRGRNNCKVYRFKTFIQLSGDKYFSREFSTPENIPLKFSLDFDTSNLESFKSYNSFFNSGYADRTRALSEYIAKVKLLEINTHFKYQNSFLVERKGVNNSTNKLHIPVAWTIKDGVQRNNYEVICVNLKNYDYINGKYIRDWFSIQNIGQLKVDHAYVSFKDGSVLNLPTPEISTSTHNGWQSYHLKGTIKKQGNEYKYEQDHLNSGIFFPNPTRGFLNSRIHVLLNDHGYYINIKNPFSFASNYISDSEAFITVWIQNKNDYLFWDLRRFRFFDL